MKSDNKLQLDDKPVHDWFRFVLSFPPHLVRYYLSRFGVTRQNRVLDPFCGTGTTLVECKKHGISSVGVEAIPFVRFVCKTKLNWDLDPVGLTKHARRVGEATKRLFDSQGISDEAEQSLFSKGNGNNGNPHPDLLRLSPDQAKLLLSGCIDPLPLHKVLVLIGVLDKLPNTEYLAHERVALAKAVVHKISNLHFGPEVGVRKSRNGVAPVVESWESCVRDMARDLRELSGARRATSKVYLGDSRSISTMVKPESIDAVITSPPYPNEKDYTRTTRLESVLLGFLKSRADLRTFKEGMVRSNTRGVFKNDDDDILVERFSSIQGIAKEIEEKRISLGKTSGFERLYARAAKLYFGGMYRHLADLRKVLRPGAQLAYVVGDQASYLRVHIPTGKLLAEIADELGYEVVDLELFRTRLATATKQQLREEVLVLRWNGPRRKRR